MGERVLFHLRPHSTHTHCETHDRRTTYISLSEPHLGQHSRCAVMIRLSFRIFYAFFQQIFYFDFHVHTCQRSCMTFCILHIPSSAFARLLFCVLAWLVSFIQCAVTQCNAGSLFLNTLVPCGTHLYPVELEACCSQAFWRCW